MLTWKGKTLGSNQAPKSMIDDIMGRRPLALVASLLGLFIYSFVLIGLTHMTAISSRTKCTIPQPLERTADALQVFQSLIRSPGDGPIAVQGTPRTDVQFGNADMESTKLGKWIIGHFLPDTSMLKSNEVEMKWARNAKGKKNGEVAVNKKGHSVGILIYGKQKYEFGNQVVVLEKTGDYCVWGPGVPHTWESMEDTLVMTLRWPSLKGDQVVVNTTF